MIIDAGWTPAVRKSMSGGPARDLSAVDLAR